MIEVFVCKIVAELAFYQFHGKDGRARAGGGIADLQAQFHVEPLPIQAAAQAQGIGLPAGQGADQGGALVKRQAQQCRAQLGLLQRLQRQVQARHMNAARRAVIETDAGCARAAIDCPCRRTGRAMSAMPTQSRGCCCSSVCVAMSGRVRLFIVLGSAVLSIQCYVITKISTAPSTE